MSKRKLTPEILELIELCSADEYTLDEIREEADIVRPLMQDPQVLEAIEKGRAKWFIEIMADDGDLENFMYCSDKSPGDIDKMYQANKEAIELRRVEIKAEEQKTNESKKNYAERMIYPAGVSAKNVACQMPENERSMFSIESLRDEIETAARRLKEGDNTALLEILIGNIHQLHLFNGYVAQNLMGDLGKQLPNFEKLSSIQLKVINEQRKSIMAINEITNPKRTTFVKEVSQHNHLHQNSEKKEDNSNELKNETKLIDHSEVTEAEVVLEKEEIEK